MAGGENLAEIALECPVSAGTEPIPADLWQRICQFIADGRTGALTLTVLHGHVTKLETRETFTPR
jgi:hypothetical protein